MRIKENDSVYCKDLGMLLIGYDKAIYKFAILRQTRTAHFGRHAYCFLGKAKTLEEAEEIKNKHQDDLYTTVLIKEFTK
jgi:hypothetical protein